ncbi:AAA family ATPase [Succinivibrio dextrinosolvens]|uniref:PD-(D/E)XK nuclease superfamily protein n=1 Tax=Succinivibrio dextrinosolvens TaxID=83771 RepID=A0A662Z8T3_9GAMM|nr:AAA family ATPase [Succinivibrio dextrinosolvens]SFJ91376.1 PD-(D/E)XK nuclease superfamily protein [Succinivibrio dextrinosolvens]
MKEIAQSENIEDFIYSNFIYIDKTEYIYNLIKSYKRVFFSRPRRFGKSLTLNTIGTLFEKGVESYFKDTWIYDKWNRNTFPVLHLNFLKYRTSNVEQFKKIFSEKIAEFASDLNLNGKVKSKEPDLAISELFRALKDRQIVILIDEYDCQLTANINKPKLYEEFRTCIREFYAALKGAKQIQFLAITGVTRLKDVSIFSVGSDIKDLSYDHAFSQMIGFTREEIKKFYIDYLKLGISYEKHIDTESVTDTDIEEFLDKMAEHYDSYCFDEFYERKVFSTYSVNNFLQSISQKQRVSFGDYWYEAGGIPSILKNYMESHEIDIEKFQTSEINIHYDDFMNPTSLPEMNENVLMCQTGYLTLKSEIKAPRRVKLGTANREVKAALNSLLSQKFFNSDKLESFFDADIILENGTVDEIISHLNSVLATIPYDKYPVENESILRALIQMYLSGLRCDVRAEQHNFKGRSDILINLDKRRIILELKYSNDGHDVNSLLEDAVNQIKDKEYGTEDLKNRELLQIAAVFDGTNEIRKITAYEVVC